MMEERELVFVYGTLRAGASNHWRMEGAEFQGKAVVRGRLYRIDWYPGLILRRDGGEVVGEVYEVRPDHLARLDGFEGAEYRRRQAEVIRIEPYFRQMVWLWEYRNEMDAIDEERWIRRGDWIEASRGRVLPLFLCIAWSPVVAIVGVAIGSGLDYLLHPESPSSPPSTAPWLAGSWEAAALIGTLPLVMAGAGMMARRRGERPRVLATIVTLLGWFGIALLGAILITLLTGAIL